MLRLVKTELVCGRRGGGTYTSLSEREFLAPVAPPGYSMAATLPDLLQPSLRPEVQAGIAAAAHSAASAMLTQQGYIKLAAQPGFGPPFADPLPPANTPAPGPGPVPVQAEQATAAAALRPPSPPPQPLLPPYLLARTLLQPPSVLSHLEEQRWYPPPPPPRPEAKPLPQAVPDAALAAAPLPAALPPAALPPVSAPVAASASSEAVMLAGIGQGSAQEPPLAEPPLAGQPPVGVAEAAPAGAAASVSEVMPELPLAAGVPPDSLVPATPPPFGTSGASLLGPDPLGPDPPPLGARHSGTSAIHSSEDGLRGRRGPRRRTFGRRLRRRRRACPAAGLTTATGTARALAAALHGERCRRRRCGVGVAAG